MNRNVKANQAGEDWTATFLQSVLFVNLEASEHRNICIMKPINTKKVQYTLN